MSEFLNGLSVKILLDNGHAVVLWHPSRQKLLVRHGPRLESHYGSLLSKRFFMCFAGEKESDLI